MSVRPRPTRPGRARLAAAVAAVVVLAVGAAVLRGERGSGEALPAVVDLTPAEVRRVVVETGGRQADLTRHDRDWSASPATPPQSAPLLLSTEDELFPMLAYRVVQADQADPQYGLVSPEAVLRLEGGAGAPVRVRIGAASFSGAGFYAARDADPGRLYLVPRAAVDLLRSLVTGERKSSADPLQERAERYRSGQDEAGPDKEISTYLRQALDAGGRPPPVPPPTAPAAAQEP